MSEQITLLGTKGGPAIRTDGALPTATLLQVSEKNIIVDCGVGVTTSIVKTGLSLLDIDAIFITHLHSDHVLELGPLLYTAWTTGLNRSIKVFGPAGIESYWTGFLKSMSFDCTIRVEDEGRTPIHEMVVVTGYDEGSVTTLGDLSISALRVKHPPVTDCFALKFTSRKHTVVCSADTAYFPSLATFASGADVLIHEAMLTSGVDKLVNRTPGASRLGEHLMQSHTRAADAGRIAEKANVGLLCLNHLVPADDPTVSEQDWIDEAGLHWSGETIVGRDGMIVPLS